MKVLDLRCSAGHIFEGWFGSEQDYQRQRETGLLQCPMCGVLTVEKTLSTPKVQAKSNTKQTPQTPQTPQQAPSAAGQAPRGQGESAPPAHQEAVQEAAAQAMANLPPEVQAQLQAHWLSVAREVVAKAEDVGADFANEARRIHHGDAPDRAIHGEASFEEAKALMDEGVAVLPLPDGVKTTMQ